MDEFIRAASPEGPVEETISPESSAEQNVLWNKLDEAYDVPAIERETAFVFLPKDEQERLASIELAEDISRVAVKLSFDPKSTRRLSRLVRYAVIGKIKLADVMESATDILNVSGETKSSLERELKALIAPEESLETPPATFRAVDSLGVSVPLKEELLVEPLVVNQVEPPVVSGVEPFMLHEETPEFIREEPRGKPSVSFEPTTLERPKTSPKPATARIGTPGEAPPVVSNIEPRVVHYNALKTKLDK